MAGPDYIIDIHGAPTPGGDGGKQSRAAARGRPWLSIRWRCCDTYSRVYRNPSGTAYVGRCPRCTRSLHIPIGPDGTSSRLFEAW